MKVVGVLGDATGDPYSLRLAQAVVAELAKENAHAISCMGGFPRAPLYRDASNLPKLPAVIDGWVLLSAPLRDASNELEAYFRSFGTR